MMTMRSLFLAAALLAASAATARAQTSEDVIAMPALRASVTVSSDVVRIGDILDHAHDLKYLPRESFSDPKIRPRKLLVNDCHTE